MHLRCFTTPSKQIFPLRNSHDYVALKMLIHLKVIQSATFKLISHLATYIFFLSLCCLYCFHIFTIYLTTNLFLAVSIYVCTYPSLGLSLFGLCSTHLKWANLIAFEIVKRRYNKKKKQKNTKTDFLL